ncbi:MAG: hypothetical protein NTY94_15415 [Alphaproteobacteria bacterium]|nr:hypothetical protein [Alphaproteobacteria bacterium]
MSIHPPVPLLGQAMAGLTDGLVARADSDRLLAPLFLALAALLRRLAARFDALVALHNAGLLHPMPAATRPAPSAAPTTPLAPSEPATPARSWRDLFAWWPWSGHAEQEWARDACAPRARRARAPEAVPQPSLHPAAPRTAPPSTPPAEPAPPRARTPMPHPQMRPDSPRAPHHAPSRRVPPTPSRKNRAPVLV